MNLLEPGAETMSGEEITESSGSPKDCLTAVVKEIGWTGRKTEEERQREWKTGKVRGKGFAMLQKAPAMPANTASSVIMQMNGDGHVKMMIGAVDIGQGAITALAQIAAQELDIPIEHIEISAEIDTRANPYDWNTVASKLTFMGGNAVIKASREMLSKMKAVAAQALRTDPENLLHANGEIFHRHNPNRRMSYKDVALGYMCTEWYRHRRSFDLQRKQHRRRSDQPPSGNRSGLSRRGLDFGAHAVEIEVDVETGVITVLKVASAFDIGQVINEKLVYGQICGGVAGVGLSNTGRLQIQR